MWVRPEGTVEFSEENHKIPALNSGVPSGRVNLSSLILQNIRTLQGNKG